MDRGGENVAMADYMIVTRGADRNSAIFGSSTHNQRIERVWRDVTKEVLVITEYSLLIWRSTFK
jgi:hypothetical protein